MVVRQQGTLSWQHLVIRASAGSGKTFRLSNRYLELIQAGEPADTILATTFTRAAAAEIQDRVLLRLAKAALDDKERRNLAGFLETESLTRQRCLELLAELTRHLHRLRIGTLDSFFIQIARSFAWELGLPASWRILDPLEDSRLRDDAIAAVLASEDRDALTRLVQWLTKGEAQRSLGDLLDTTVAKLYDLYREAPREAWTRIPRPKGLDAGELAACITALKSVPLPTHKSIAKGHQNDLEAVQNGDWEQLPLRGIAGVVAQGKDTYYNKQLDERTIEVYAQLLRHASAVFLGKVAAQTEATYELLARFETQYDRLKRHAGGLLFSDVTHLVGAWFQQQQLPQQQLPQQQLPQQQLPQQQQGATLPEVSPGTPSLESLEQVAFRLDSHLNHLLLDEFQDTSLPQWNVLRPLAQRITSSAGGHSFFCVGDVKQAIFGWRGGNAEIFDALKDDLQELVSDPLNESRRSSPVVIEVVNRVFRDMTRHERLERSARAVQQWSQDFPVHTTALHDLPGFVTLAAGPAPSEEDDDDKPLLTHAAARIQQLVAEAPGASVGVLVRSNATIAELIFRLRRIGVAASEEGGNPLVDSAAVQLILSALEFADHPGHSVARLHLEYSRLGAALKMPPTGSDAAAFAGKACELRRQLISAGYGPTIERWTKTLAPDCDAREWRRLNQLVARAYAYERSATLRPRDFVAAVRQERAADPTSADVKVTTIHKSKGLQYDIVVLPELSTPLIGQPDGYVAGRSSQIGPVNIVCRHVRQELRGLLPPKLQELFEEQDRQDTVESLCVLYVALTRAVHAVHLFVNPAPKGEKSGLPKTFAGLLRAALTDGRPLAPLEVAFAEGDPRWYDKRKSRPLPPPAPCVPVELRLAPTTGPRRRGLERVTPSELEGGRCVRLAPSLSSDGLGGRQRGTLLHAWFERIGWLSDGVPADATLRPIANRVLDTPFTTGQLDEWLRAFHQALRASEVAAVLERSYYANLQAIGFPASVAGLAQGVETVLEVFNERRFAVRADDQLVSGTMDRLVVISCGGRAVAADVVDFKTDAIPEGDAQALSDKVAYYRPQLTAYREAVANSLSLEPGHVTARLAFLSVGKVVTVRA